jgi:hypothetical protein
MFFLDSFRYLYCYSSGIRTLIATRCFLPVMFVHHKHVLFTCNPMRRRLVAPHRLIGIYIGVMAIGSLEKRLDANGEIWEAL